MNEKELRLALVCFGGISLAVYMHGITKEVLKLARASRTYHASPDASAHRDARYAELAEAGPDTDTIDTEAVYFELLKRIGERLRLRVIVDVVSGASAGGVNGVLLARALAHDLRFDPLREMWLEKADVEELLAPERRAAGHSKWFMRPLLWWFNRSPFARLTPDEEMRRKLSLFVRSRWFRPPFSGHSLSTFLLDAMTAMQPDGERRSHSLLPSQQPLDLFVTVTDYYGYAQ
ncbi:MAG TPA: patatin-like phospholipase family protein, partial [Alphaproteobacteria bacterium]|nr:patatin-like phospholipase family protein [Alphaproteobacteria bacterium]